MKILLLVLLLIPFHTKSQSKPKFDDLIEVLDDGKIKFYLGSTFKTAYKNCADFYMVADFEKGKFQIKDTLKVYYKTNQLYLKGYYRNGVKEGVFTWYDKDGQTLISGEYKAGLRDGEWQYTNSKGHKYKTIIYKDNFEYLRELTDKSGTSLVENGIGTFQDNLQLTTSNTEKSHLKGEILNGFPNGEWIISIGGTKVGTEYFEDNLFVKGVSHSIVLGNQEYTSEFLSTVSGVNYIEHLDLFGPSICRNKSSAQFSKAFRSKLKDRLVKGGKLNHGLKGWFIVEIISANNDDIEKVEVHSNSTPEINSFVKGTIKDLKKIENGSFRLPGKKVTLFPIMISDNSIFFEDSIID